VKVALLRANLAGRQLPAVLANASKQALEAEYLWVKAELNSPNRRRCGTLGPGGA
jgi:hypothetical protein